jgi:MFS superfamily sulfate permease-like transporter
VLLTLSITVFLVSHVEGYLFASQYASLNKYKIDKNQELLALGASNLVVGLFQGLPIGGAPSRTAVNNESGSKTPLAGGISGIVILLVLVLFTGIFYNLPQAILAAVVLFVIKRLIDIPHFRKTYKFSRIEFAVAIVTLLTVLFIGALEGIVIGVILSVLSLLKNMYNPHIAILGRIPGTVQYLDIKRRPEAEIASHTLIVRVDGSQIFLNTESVKNTIIDLVDGKYKDTKLFVLDFEATSFIDYSGIEMLEELVDELKADKVIFDDKLTAVQIYNLSELCGLEVIDRFNLILEIFAQRARTREAKLQVELANLIYERPKARMKVTLAKKGEQPGFKGLGRYQADIYESEITGKIA